MAEFLWTEGAGTTLEERPRFARSAFGDGYEERAPAGLNPLAQRWSVPMREVDNAIADEIVAFLRARSNALGLEAFDWTPPWATASIRVICPGWTRTMASSYRMSDLSMSFEQVFEP